MNIEIKALTKELINDYLKFFDDIAFSDHKEWSYCYCCGFHFDDNDIQSIHTKKKMDGTEAEGLRNEAISLINEGILQGYLAYEKNNVIGWCNCNNKTNYKRLCVRNELWEENDKNKKIKSIVCFIVAPDMRGKGIATRLLDHICSDAKKDGFLYIESYPIKNEGNCYDHYPGPYKLYEKKGFIVYKELEKEMILRKYIKQ